MYYMFQFKFILSFLLLLGSHTSQRSQYISSRRTSSGSSSRRTSSSGNSSASRTGSSKSDIITGCIDSHGQEVAHMSTYQPLRSDPCMSCTCVRGSPFFCLTAQCEAPSCELFEQSEHECCSYTCLEEGGREEGDSSKHITEPNGGNHYLRSSCNYIEIVKRT